MPDIKNPKFAIPIVLIAGLFWSFGPYVVRHISEAHTVPWQYLFTRGLVIFILLNIYLFLEEGIEFYKNYLKIGLSGLIGGIGLGIAMTTFIWSITNTSAAITLLCLAAMPFITALLDFYFLRRIFQLVYGYPYLFLQSELLLWHSEITIQVHFSDLFLECFHP